MKNTNAPKCYTCARIQPSTLKKHTHAPGVGVDGRGGEAPPLLCCRCCCCCCCCCPKRGRRRRRDRPVCHMCTLYYTHLGRDRADWRHRHQPSTHTRMYTQTHPNGNEAAAGSSRRGATTPTFLPTAPLPPLLLPSDRATVNGNAAPVGVVGRRPAATMEEAAAAVRRCIMWIDPVCIY